MRARRTFTALCHYGRSEDNLRLREWYGESGFRQRESTTGSRTPRPASDANAFRARCSGRKTTVGTRAMRDTVERGDRARVPSCVPVTIRGYPAIANARPAFCTFPARRACTR